MVGMILGNRYEILEEVGGGGMAKVYRARCRLLNRFVAVKVLKPELAADEDFLKRFHKEAQAACGAEQPAYRRGVRRRPGRRYPLYCDGIR